MGLRLIPVRSARAVKESTMMRIAIAINSRVPGVPRVPPGAVRDALRRCGSVRTARAYCLSTARNARRMPCRPTFPIGSGTLSPQPRTKRGCATYPPRVCANRSPRARPYRRKPQSARGFDPPPRIKWGCATYPLARGSAPPPRTKWGCAPYPPRSPCRMIS
jgi:hypothetical protein